MKLALIVFLALIPSIATLKCYICNSIEDGKCEAGSLASFEKACTVVDPYCRKITQTINGKTSVVRSCGSKIGSKSCYKTAGINSANVCSCNTDLCNSAPAHNRQQQIMTIISSFAAVAIGMIVLR